jgi:hypothetical protein
VEVATRELLVVVDLVQVIREVRVRALLLEGVLSRVVPVVVFVIELLCAALEESIVG